MYTSNGNKEGLLKGMKKALEQNDTKQKLAPLKGHGYPTSDVAQKATIDAARVRYWNASLNTDQLGGDGDELSRYRERLQHQTLLSRGVFNNLASTPLDDGYDDIHTSHGDGLDHISNPPAPLMPPPPLFGLAAVAHLHRPPLLLAALAAPHTGSLSQPLKPLCSMLSPEPMEGDDAARRSGGTITNWTRRVGTLPAHRNGKTGPCCVSCRRCRSLSLSTLHRCSIP